MKQVDCVLLPAPRYRVWHPALPVTYPQRRHGVCATAHHGAALSLRLPERKR